MPDAFNAATLGAFGSFASFFDPLFDPSDPGSSSLPSTVIVNVPPSSPTYGQPPSLPAAAGADQLAPLGTFGDFGALPFLLFPFLCSFAALTCLGAFALGAFGAFALGAFALTSLGAFAAVTGFRSTTSTVVVRSCNLPAAVVEAPPVVVSALPEAVVSAAEGGDSVVVVASALPLVVVTSFVVVSEALSRPSCRPPDTVVVAASALPVVPAFVVAALTMVGGAPSPVVVYEPNGNHDVVAGGFRSAGISVVVESPCTTATKIARVARLRIWCGLVVPCLSGRAGHVEYRMIVCKKEGGNGEKKN